jgi:hypothetical protein
LVVVARRGEFKQICGYAAGLKLGQVFAPKFTASTRTCGATRFAPAGDLLHELGYETEGRVRKITPSERWMWKLHHRLSGLPQAESKSLLPGSAGGVRQARRDVGAQDEGEGGRGYEVAVI